VDSARQRLLGLCLAPALLSALDCTVTLFGQSSQYWAGNYGHVNEGSPTFCQLLQVHPAAFIAGGAAWIMVFVSTNCTPKGKKKLRQALPKCMIDR